MALDTVSDTSGLECPHPSSGHNNNTFSIRLLGGFGKSTFIKHLKEGLQAFSVMGQIVNIFGFAGQMAQTAICGVTHSVAELNNSCKIRR